SQEEKYLCAYIVPTLEKAFGNTLSQELREYLSQTLPDYMIPSYFIRIEKIPLNPNGKVNRRALPVPEIAEVEKVYTPPRDETEDKLAAIWAEVLGTSRSTIGIDDNFFQRGGHSLKGTVLISRIHKAFNVKLSLGDIFKAPTIRKISGYINESIEDQFHLIEKAEKKEYYVLSSAQKRLYILDQMEPDNTVYNMPMVYHLETGCDIKRLEDAFRQLIRRHESFRTSFITVNDEPVQKIHDEVEFEIEYFNLATENTENTEGTRGLAPLFKPEKNFIRPFALSRAPLLRAGIINTGENKTLLLIDMHHTISDGISIQVFQNELTELYDLNPLPPLNIQYKDYAQWHHKEIRKEKIKNQKEYWLKEFSGEIPVLNLPLDDARPAIQSFEGDALLFEIGKNEAGALRELAKDQGATLFMILIALFNILLNKLSGQEDIVIGTPAAGRRHADLQNTIGMFVNTLAMRNFPSGAKPFNQFLTEIKTKTLEVFENQEYQFEELVETLEVTRDASRNPLFDVMFALQNMEKTKPYHRTLELEPYNYQSNIAKFDMVLGAQETPKGLSFELEYCSKLFKKETVKRFIKYFEKIISSVITNPQAKISSIEILTNEETREILYGFNKREPVYPKDKTIPGLFSQQVEQIPDNIAVVGTHELHEKGTRGLAPLYITYKELNQQANQLAYMLAKKGVKPDTIVGILMERSIEMIIGIIAILKAGGAYLPINPKNPAGRIKYLLEDSNVGVLVTTPKHQVKVKGGFIEIIDISNLASFSTSTLTSTCQVSPTNLAYIIYTSGSTGNPKGVPITHSNLSPLLHWGYQHLGLNSHDRVVQNLSYFFDWSVWEIFITLTSGAGLFTAGDDMLLNPEIMIQFTRKNGITALHITPTQFQALINFNENEPGQDETVKLATLKHLCIGAEKLTYELVKRSFAVVTERCRVYNMYGPTEATIISAVLEIDRSDYHRFCSLTSVPIGIPAGNAILLVMDKYLKLCPVNVVGELYIGGDSISQGYFNNPELTAQKFCLRRPGALFEKTAPGPRKNFLLSWYHSHHSTTHHSPLTIYQTGDLVRWLADGNIEFLGRADQQVKIRGLRIELGEIESRLRKHDDIKEVVVTTKETANGELYLCAFYVPCIRAESGEPLEIQDLRDYLSGQMADYMIPAYFIPIPQIPLNPNGKVDLKALPTPEITRDKEYIPPRDTLEKKLVKTWAKILEREEHLIGIDDNFFQMGGHSLKATQLLAEIHKEFNAKISQVQFFNTPNIRGLSKHLKEAIKNKSRFISINPGEKKEYYPLSPAQKKFYILNQLEPQGTIYHMYDIYVLAGKVDREKMENAFKKLIRRHDAFRTSFMVVKGEPVQKIHDTVDFKIEYYDLQATGEEERLQAIKNFLRPFDLAQAPLLRVGLIKQEEENHLFLFDMHHIISDAISFKITVDEFMNLFAGKDNQVPGLKYRYKDYAEWQEKLVQSGEMKRQEEYWTREFPGSLPVLDLPLDYQRPAVQSFEGDNIHFSISPQEALTLKEYAREQDATMFMVALAVFYVFLAKLSGQEDIIIGTPVAGRRYSELYNIIGVFINTLALRNYPQADKSFEQLLGEVRTRTLEAFENQDYQFDDLVKKTRVPRDSSRNPIFNVLYSFVSQEETEQPAPPGANPATPQQDAFLKLKTYKFQGYQAMLDLILTVITVNRTREILFNFGYCTKLFKKETIEKFITYFKEIIAAVVKDKHVRLKEIKISLDLEEANLELPQIEFGF
ncbi:MAG: amino acid adenylation domain-containing protein, partial [Candidatus Aminicenantes bacterium]